MGKQIVLEGEGIATGYRQGKQLTEVHHGLDFSLSGGELTCLLGCNGAGKSTLLTDRMQAGGLTVYELVALGRQPYTGFFGRLTSADKALVWRALEEVGMAGKARRYVAELSDGERQKAMIAKVLVQECPLILLDEPTAFLDVESRMEVMRLLRKLAVEEHKAVLLSTHDVDQALAMSDRLWLMTQEREMLCGTTEDLVLSGAMDRLFGSTSIRFDAVRGIYAPENRNSRVVRLEAADEALRYWAQNLLVRHGFRPVAPDEGGEGAASLAVISPHDMVWTQNGTSSRFCSFAGLVEMLEFFIRELFLYPDGYGFKSQVFYYPVDSFAGARHGIPRSTRSMYRISSPIWSLSCMESG